VIPSARFAQANIKAMDEGERRTTGKRREGEKRKRRFWPPLRSFGMKKKRESMCNSFLFAEPMQKRTKKKKGERRRHTIHPPDFLFLGMFRGGGG